MGFVKKEKEVKKEIKEEDDDGEVEIDAESMGAIEREELEFRKDKEIASKSPRTALLMYNL